MMHKDGCTAFIPKFSLVAIGCVVLLAFATVAVRAQDSAAINTSSRTLTSSNGGIHYFPTRSEAAAVNQAADTGPLVYHSGGKVMISPQTYAIFWTPSKLQN